MYFHARLFWTHFFLVSVDANIDALVEAEQIRRVFYLDHALPVIPSFLIQFHRTFLILWNLGICARAYVINLTFDDTTIY